MYICVRSILNKSLDILKMYIKFLEWQTQNLIPRELILCINKQHIIMSKLIIKFDDVKRTRKLYNNTKIYIDYGHYNICMWIIAIVKFTSYTWVIYV